MGPGGTSTGLVTTVTGGGTAVPLAATSFDTPPTELLFMITGLEDGSLTDWATFVMNSNATGGTEELVTEETDEFVPDPVGGAPLLEPSLCFN